MLTVETTNCLKTIIKLKKQNPIRFFLWSADEGKC